MKKTIITEGELISRARGLREYISVLEAVFDPNVKALQDKLIAAGAKIKADGFMGPATRAAQAQFPNVTTQTDTENKAGANINSANTTPTTTTYDDGSTMSTGANGAVSSTDTSGAAYKPGSNPALTKPAAAAPVAPAPAAPAAWTPTPEQATWLGKADQQDPYILNRMPGVKPPVTHFKDPADQAKAKQMGFPAAAAPAAAAPAAAAPAAAAPVTIEETTRYSDEQTLARIVDLARR